MLIIPPDTEEQETLPLPLILKIDKLTLKKAVDQLIKIGVLKKIHNSKWAASTCIILNINGTVRFISDFREINKTIKTKPFPIP